MSTWVLRTTPGIDAYPIPDGRDVDAVDIDVGAAEPMPARRFDWAARDAYTLRDMVFHEGPVWYDATGGMLKLLPAPEYEHSVTVHLR